MDLSILVEVGVSAIIQKVILIGVGKLSMQQLVGISLVLAALGAILWVHMRARYFGSPLSFGRRTLGLRRAENDEGEGATS